MKQVAQVTCETDLETVKAFEKWVKKEHSNKNATLRKLLLLYNSSRSLRRQVREYDGTGKKRLSTTLEDPMQHE